MLNRSPKCGGYRPWLGETGREPCEEPLRLIVRTDSERFIDQPPREVYGALLSEGIYFCHWRTMYRLLVERGPVQERRNQREPKHHAVPRLVAEAPNQVWSWDISKLPTHERGVFLNLYVVLDMFSRFAVAWMLAQHENAALAKQLFREAVQRYGVAPDTLTVHQDRGAPMTSHTFADLLTELGVERSYSRPRVSNDNPQSESCFRTVKGQPDYPGRFRDLEHGRAWCTDFFSWYNTEHHHTGLALFTPEQVFMGQVERVAARRQQALDEAYARTPERFVGGAPVVHRPPSQVKLNPLDAAPPTVERVLQTPDDAVAELWPAPSTAMPVVNLPGIQPESHTT